jgi:hypothetical protein
MGIPLAYSISGGSMFENLYDVAKSEREKYAQWWFIPAHMEVLPAGLITDEI